MGSIMKKELVLVKDLHNHWSCVLCVTCTEGKNITDASEAIELMRNEYNDLASAEFIQEGDCIFAMVSLEFGTINPGERCK
jgi:hypothetical protein